MNARQLPRWIPILPAALVLGAAASALVLAQGSPLTGGCAGGALGPAHDQPGALCEDFDTDRNGSGSITWSRLYPAGAVCDPYRVLEDPSDDILGHSVSGGPHPYGVAGTICSVDAAFPQALATCHVAPAENDWHLHSPFEGCDGDDSYDGGDPNFASTCAPDAKAHSGLRSLHLGRHLRAADTAWDTYRFRQTSAFVMDPVHLSPSARLEFWQIIWACNTECISLGANGTTGGGQSQISLRDPNRGVYGPWRRLTPGENGYDSVAQDLKIFCEFDPGDDDLPPSDETMCLPSSPQWAHIGDPLGTDRTCTTDTDGSDPTWLDCGRTDTRTVDPNCSWVADPNCGSFLENGAAGAGVWARSRIDLSPFGGEHARLRWVFQGGGGWGFGESRSFLEPEPGFSPYFSYGVDEGWYIDDIRITDALETVPLCIDGDGDGFGFPADPLCPDPRPDCGCLDENVFPGAPEICDRVDSDCDLVIPAEEIDGDGDDVAPCEGDCADDDPSNIRTPAPVSALTAVPERSGVILAWEDQAGTAGPATVYDLFTGLISDLRSGAGFGAGSCEKNDLGASSYSAHGPDPSPGDGRYWIVRGQNGCPAGDGTWGSALRDAQTSASAQACD